MLTAGTDTPIQTRNLSYAHETCDSLQQFLFAGCLGLSPGILTQFTLELCTIAENCFKKSLKFSILGV